MEFRADLHCHSTCSDGTMTPHELVLLAKQVGLSGLAITDHDAIDAYGLALPTAMREGIELITGAEFSAFYRETSVHVLAYSFQPDSESLKSFCQQHTLRRQERNRAILDLLTSHQMPVTEEEVVSFSPCAQGSFGRVHIAQALLQKGYVESLQEAFKKYLGEGLPCYAPGKPISVEETIEAIHNAGGFAVIAHPHLMKQGTVLRTLLTMPFDGLEAYYGRFLQHENAKWTRIAQEKGWLMTGGSDFHGEVKPEVHLGSSWVPEATFRFLQNRMS